MTPKTNEGDIRGWLVENFQSNADWRRQKAVEFPADDRNAAAAALLDRLAASVADVPVDLLEAFDQHEYDARQAEIMSEMLREVGFYSEPRNATEFLREYFELSVKG